MTGRPSLSLVVPVRDDRTGVKALLAAAGAAKCFDRFVLIDDGSVPRLRLPIRLPPGLSRRQITLLRNDRSLGAGQARNRAFRDLCTSHVLFFDADDMLTPEIGPLWRHLAGKEFDFCQFRYGDSRFVRRGLPGQLSADDHLWRRAGCAVGALGAADPACWPLLAQTANYPWNKIYRTAFLRDHEMRFSETPVHNDIALHWLGFHHARRILVSDRVAALHVVRDAGARLTNRRGRDRLRVIEEVLVPLARRLTAERGVTDPLYLAFLSFASGLADWIPGELEAQWREPFRVGFGRFLAEHCPPDARAALALRDAAAAARLDRQAPAGAAG